MEQPKKNETTRKRYRIKLTPRQHARLDDYDNQAYCDAFDTVRRCRRVVEHVVLGAPYPCDTCLDSNL